jgi:hypothetical protein
LQSVIEDMWSQSAAPLVLADASSQIQTNAIAASKVSKASIPRRTRIELGAMMFDGDGNGCYKPGRKSQLEKCCADLFRQNSQLLGSSFCGVTSFCAWLPTH